MVPHLQWREQGSGNQMVEIEADSLNLTLGDPLGKFKIWVLITMF